MTPISSEELRERLRECPFCGGEPKVIRLIEDNDAFEREVMIRCDVCAIAICEEYHSEAVAAWNRRASDTADQRNAELLEALKVIANASERSETMFGGKMSEVTRVFEHITRVARLAISRATGGKDYE